MTSKLKVNLINDSGDNNIITSDGSGVITSSKFKIGQIVNATTTTQVQTTSSTFIDSTIVASITPSSTSSKIIINIQMFCQLFGNSVESKVLGKYQLVRTIGGECYKYFYFK